MGNNQQIPPSNQRQHRDAETDIVAGANETDQIQGLKENVDKMPNKNEESGTSPKNFEVDKGENSKLRKS